MAKQGQKQMKMNLEAGRRRTIWRLVNKDKTKAGVVSSVPNCGYTQEQLASLAKKGYRIKQEEVE